MTKRLKAFTIMEVTVAMLLAAIVIAITYTAYGIVMRTYGNYHAKSEATAMLTQLNGVLRRDFERAAEIDKTEVGLSLTRADSTVILYEFNADYIVRKGTAIDTFYVHPAMPLTWFEGEAVSELAADPERNRIDELEFVLPFEGNNIPYHYYKQYSSANLMERKNDAGN